jgi:hypothetical protein
VKGAGAAMSEKKEDQKKQRPAQKQAQHPAVKAK